MKRIIALTFLAFNNLYCGSSVADSNNPDYRAYVDFLDLKEKVENLKELPTEHGDKEWQEIMRLVFEQIKYIREQDEIVKDNLRDINKIVKHNKEEVYKQKQIEALDKILDNND